MLPQFNKTGSGKTLIYIPGIEGTGKLLYKQERDLSRDHTVVSVPLRPNGNYGLDRLVDDIQLIATEVGPSPITVLAESFGGLVAVATALANPTLIDKMILLNSFPRFQQRAKIHSGVALFSILPYSLIKAYRTNRSRDELFSGDISHEDRKTFHDLTKIVPPEGYLSRLRIIRDTDLRPRLKDVKARTLVVAGSSDKLFDSVTYGQQFCSAIPRARLKVLHGTGHVALLAKDVSVRQWLLELDEI